MSTRQQAIELADTIEEDGCCAHRKEAVQLLRSLSAPAAINERHIREAAASHGVQFVSRSHGLCSTSTISLDTLTSIFHDTLATLDKPKCSECHGDGYVSAPCPACNGLAAKPVAWRIVVGGMYEYFSTAQQACEARPDGEFVPEPLYAASGVPLVDRHTECSKVPDEFSTSKEDGK